MKTNRKFISGCLRGLLFLSVLVFFTGCTKDDKRGGGYGSSSPFIGTWTGSTSQGETISMTIDVRNNKICVIRYSLAVKLANNTTEVRQNNSNTCIAQVTTNSISILDGGVGQATSINGTFLSNNTRLEGNFQVEIQGTNEVISGNYFAVK